MNMYDKLTGVDLKNQPENVGEFMEKEKLPVTNVR